MSDGPLAAVLPSIVTRSLVYPREAQRMDVPVFSKLGCTHMMFLLLNGKASHLADARTMAKRTHTAMHWADVWGVLSMRADHLKVVLQDLE